MTFTVELKKDYALRILEDLQELDAIRFRPSPQHEVGKTRTFQAIHISTQGFSFDRNEANERYNKLAIINPSA